MVGKKIMATARGDYLGTKLRRDIPENPILHRSCSVHKSINYLIYNAFMFRVWVLSRPRRGFESRWGRKVKTRGYSFSGCNPFVLCD